MCVRRIRKKKLPLTIVSDISLHSFFTPYRLIINIIKKLRKELTRETLI